MIPRWARALAGITLGVVLLWFATRQIDLSQVAAAILDAHVPDLAMALFLYWSDIAVRCVRWRLLIAQETRLSYAQVARALVVGYAVNNVLPARLGELFRADYVARHAAITRAGALGSIVVERLLDALILVTVFGLGLLSLPGLLGVALKGAAMAAAAAVLVGGGIVVAASYLRDGGTQTRFAGLRRRLAPMVGAFGIVRGRGIVAPLLLSCVIWFLESGAIYFIVQSAHVDPALSALCVIVGAASLSTLLPSAPGYVGSLQAAFMIAFSALGLNTILGIAAATLMQGVLIGSMTVVGLVVLAGSSVSGRRDGAAPSLTA